MNKIRVSIVDDQALLRDGLKTILEMEEDLEIVGLAKNGLEALEIAATCQPDVILLDIRMPLMDGVETVKIIKKRYPQIKVIILTTFNDDEYIIGAIANGANGYLLKDIEVEKLIEGIHDVYYGKMIIPPEVHIKLSEGLGRLDALRKEECIKLPVELSNREMEISRMMVRGFNNKQIAMALFITEGTVRNYISAIYGKIGITERTPAVLYLKELGIK